MSTRSEPGHGDRLAFDEVLLGGLAADGGLYIPEHVPKLHEDAGPEARHTSYAELAARIMAPYVDGAVDDDELASLVADAYATFDHP
ncbi:MAG: threonine synthase, partial [Acidimicrobiaceae bacterium]|nr:threonine synthase [Acidimicrobiaceae bacterium]